MGPHWCVQHLFLTASWQQLPRVGIGTRESKLKAARPQGASHMYPMKWCQDLRNTPPTRSQEPSWKGKKDVLRVRLHVGALNVQARSTDRALKLQTCNATSSCVWDVCSVCQFIWSSWASSDLLRWQWGGWVQFPSSSRGSCSRGRFMCSHSLGWKYK